MAARSEACRCGRLRYERTCELGFTFHCHCSFWRRMHGSAFIVVGSLDDQRDVAPWPHLNTKSKARWIEIADALPQFAAFPSSEEIHDLARRRGRAAAR